MKKADKVEVSGEVENPLDKSYGTLNCDLTPVPKGSEMYDIIETYMTQTQGYRKLQIVDIFELNRHSEPERFAVHKKIENRRLLWHGTNVAVVAAILASGLRIMPHSGGRVGKGIYLASENGKSAGYGKNNNLFSFFLFSLLLSVSCSPSPPALVVQCAGNTGIMFLAEGALGKEHSITVDDSRLVAPPKGFDSIIARGNTEPDPKKDITIQIDGRDVVVPQGKPIPNPLGKGSNFSQSEYLLYQENQVRLRYLLRLKFN